MQFIYNKNRKKNFMYYPVVDCEHEGDIRSAEDEVFDAGGSIQASYWDGEDGGEAFVVVHSDSVEELEAVREHLGVRCTIYM